MRSDENDQKARKKSKEKSRILLTETGKSDNFLIKESDQRYKGGKPGTETKSSGCGRKEPVQTQHICQRTGNR